MRNAMRNASTDFLPYYEPVGVPPLDMLSNLDEGDETHSQDPKKLISQTVFDQIVRNWQMGKRRPRELDIPEELLKEIKHDGGTEKWLLKQATQIYGPTILKAHKNRKRLEGKIPDFLWIHVQRCGKKAWLGFHGFLRAR